MKTTRLRKGGADSEPQSEETWSLGGGLASLRSWACVRVVCCVGGVPASRASRGPSRSGLEHSGGRRGRRPEGGSEKGTGSDAATLLQPQILPLFGCGLVSKAKAKGVDKTPRGINPAQNRLPARKAPVVAHIRKVQESPSCRRSQGEIDRPGQSRQLSRSGNTPRNQISPPAPFCLSRAVSLRCTLPSLVYSLYRCSHYFCGRHTTSVRPCSAPAISALKNSLMPPSAATPQSSHTPPDIPDFAGSPG